MDLGFADQTLDLADTWRCMPLRGRWVMAVSRTTSLPRIAPAGSDHSSACAIVLRMIFASSSANRCLVLEIARARVCAVRIQFQSALWPSDCACGSRSTR